MFVRCTTNNKGHRAFAFFDYIEQITTSNYVNYMMATPQLFYYLSAQLHAELNAELQIRSCRFAVAQLQTVDSQLRSCRLRSCRHPDAADHAESQH